MEMNDMVIISVDDYIIELLDMFDKYLLVEDLKIVFKFDIDENGKSFWIYQGMYMLLVGFNVVVGCFLEEYGMEFNLLEEMCEGVYNVDVCINDMNVNGVVVLLNFGICVGFDGGCFYKVLDKVFFFKYLCVYNDWYIDEWCGVYFG